MAKTGHNRVREIASLSVTSRIEQARAKADTLVDRCAEIERIHANNRHLIFRDTFDGKLHQTFAGNAYEVLWITSFAFEVLRIMALWDSPSADRVSIPEVIALMDDPSVVSALRSDYLKLYNEEDLKFFPGHERRFDRCLRHAKHLTEVLEKSERLARLKRHRDKFFAHNLTVETISPKFGHERKVLRLSEHIVNCLRCVLSGAGFDFPGTRLLTKKHAAEFWSGLEWRQPAGHA